MSKQKDRKNRLIKNQRGFLRVKRMTVERLRTFEGFEQYSVNEAQQAIDNMERLAKILDRFLKKQKI